MYDDSDIDAAVAAGTLAATDAQRLRRFVAERRAAPPPLERDRHFRFTASLGDILPAVGVLLLLAGAAIVAMPMMKSCTGAVVAAIGWLCSYRLARGRIGIPTTVAFFAFAFGCATTLTALSFGPAATANAINPAAGLFVAGGSAIACWLYWRRFRLPIAVPVTLLASITVCDHLLMFAFPVPPAALVTGWTLAYAVTLFAAAMWWDASDVYRQTIRSDVAFWMHALAAFLLTASVFRAVFSTRGMATGWNALWALPQVFFGFDVAATAVAITLGFCLLALIIDRRAMLIISLLFVAALARKSFWDIGVAPTLVVTGGLAVGLTLHWTACRRKLLGWLPTTVRAQVPRSDPEFWYARPIT